MASYLTHIDKLSVTETNILKFNFLFFGFIGIVEYIHRLQGVRNGASTNGKTNPCKARLLKKIHVYQITKTIYNKYIHKLI